MAVMLFGTAGCLAQEAERGTVNQPDVNNKSAQSVTVGSDAGPRRILGVVPASDVTSTTKSKQLSPRQKFALFAGETYDPFEWMTSAAEAGLEQAANEPKGYGQGSKGYLKRFGAGVTDESTGEFFGTFLLPTMLHQDPRYFRSGVGTFAARVGYSATRFIITRSDAGTRQFKLVEDTGNINVGRHFECVLSEAGARIRTHRPANSHSSRHSVCV